MKQILQLKYILKKIKSMLNDIKEMKAKWTQRQAIGTVGRWEKNEESSMTWGIEKSKNSGYWVQERLKMPKYT